MTDRELEELLDSKIRELLVKQLEELEENSPANLFARKMFDDVMQHHKIPYYYRVRRRLEQ
jgi:mRNA-degrading endonuclease RelE of RelBE toxin-antitoxin system